MSLAVTISPLAACDKTAWAALWCDYLAFYKTRRDDAILDATFARYTDPARPDMRAWLAHLDGKVTGLAHAIAHPHGWQLADVTYLQDLFTAPAARRHGVARALIETVYADADAAGRPSVYWLTATDNTAARALYDRIATPTGFMKYARG